MKRRRRIIIISGGPAGDLIRKHLESLGVTPEDIKTFEDALQDGLLQAPEDPEEDPADWWKKGG